VVELVAFRAVELCVSEAVLAEYREVFRRPKFARLDPKHVSQLLRLIEAEATVVWPTEVLTVSKHDSDNRFYECASANYIVTGNTKDFTKPYKDVRIINSRQFLEVMTSGHFPVP